MKSEVRNSDTHPILVNFLPHQWSENNNKLGVTFAPGKKQPHGMTGPWYRDLVKDLTRLKFEYKIDTLVCLLQEEQMIRFEIKNEFEQCEKLKISTYHFPVVDESIPKDIESYKKLVNLIVDDHLKKGKNVIVHCLGGLGRAGTFSAACLIRDNLNAKQSISMVRNNRKGSVTAKIQCEFLQQLKFD